MDDYRQKTRVSKSPRNTEDNQNEPLTWRRNTNFLLSAFSEDHAIAQLSHTIENTRQQSPTAWWDWATGKNEFVWNVVQILLGVVSYVVVVARMRTHRWQHEHDPEAFDPIWVPCCVIGAFMLLDFVVLFYWRRMWAIPIVYAAADFAILVGSMATTGRVFAVLCMARICRILRIQQLVLLLTASRHTLEAGHESHKQRRKLFAILTFLFSTLLCVLLVSAALFPLVEPENFETWGTGLYFAVVTISTVGYGDLNTTSNLGRMASVVLILITFLFIPILLGRMLQTYSDLTRSMVGRVVRFGRRGNFVIVTGRFGLQEVKAFVEELYCDDNKEAVFALMGGYPDIDFIQDVEPSKAIQEFISQPVFRNRLSYTMADPSDLMDLETINADKAMGFFVLSDRLCDTDDEQGDLRAVIYALALSHYCPYTRLQLQVYSMRYKDLARAMGLNNCVCIESLRGIVLGNGLRCPSLTPMTMNLLRSGLGGGLASESQHNWEDEYVYGMSMELYEVQLDAFAGRTASSIAKEMYLNRMVTLVAIKSKGAAGWMLFPGQFYVAERGDLGFVFASNFSDATVASNLPAEVIFRDSIEHRQSHTLKRVQSMVHSSTTRLTPVPKRRATTIINERQGGEQYSAFRIVDDPLVLVRMQNHFHEVLGSVAVDETFLPQFLTIEHSKSVKAYNTLDTPVPLEHAMIADGEGIDFEGHVVICGSMQGMAHTVSQLRRQLLRSFPRVVFILREPPTAEVWRPLSCFSHIYVIVGDMSTPHVFMRANVHHCHAVLVTTPSANNTTNKSQMWTADSVVVMTTLILENVLAHSIRKPHILTEVRTDNNSQLLTFVTRDTRGRSELETVGSARHTPAFASGRSVTTDQFRGNMIVQMFLKPNFSNAIHLLLFGQTVQLQMTDEPERRSTSLVDDSPNIHKTGTVASTNSTSSTNKAANDAQSPRNRVASVESDPLPNAMWNDKSDDEGDAQAVPSLPAASQLKPPKPEQQKIITRELYLHQEVVPPRLHGATCARLFEEFIANDTIVLGLYRAAGTYYAPMPYQITNPPPDLKIVAGDIAIVLGFSMPKSQSSLRVVKTQS